MSLGLGHSMSRFKLKFSTDKVDTMVIQAIALLDDLDKEINIYSMRVKVRCGEWTSQSVADSRNGTDGTSPRWARSSSTTSPTPRLSRPWVS
jgi:nucleolar protein 58